MNITKVEAYKASDGTIYKTWEQAQKRELFLFTSKGIDFMWSNREMLIELLSSHPEPVDVDSSGDCDFRGEPEPPESIAKTLDNSGDPRAWPIHPVDTRVKAEDFPRFRTLG